MRTRVIITLIVIAGTILLLIFNFRPASPVKPGESGRAAQDMPSMSNTLSDASAQHAERANGNTPTARSTAAGSQSPANPAEAKRELSNIVEQGVARFNEDFRWPIAFYGKALDEVGNPVSEAGTHFSWTMVYPNEPGNLYTKTDSNGLFSLAGATGRTLTVDIAKPGYYTVKTNQTRFEYSQGYNAAYHVPDVSYPVIFNLRKKGPGTDLVTSQYGVAPDLKVSVPRDGNPIYVDLLSRRAGPGGQLEITQLKPEYREWKQATEWRFRMSIPDGGFIEHCDEFPFEAPEAGYQPVVEFHFNKADTNWTTRLQKQYYIAFGQPRRYGRLVLETEMQAAGTRLQYAINPDGSRYLEPKERQPQRRELPPGVVEIIPKQTE